MGRTNIKTPSRGSEYFIRPYARGKDDTYMDVSQQVTQAYVDTQVVMPHSIFSRPYLADAYPEMEYEYKPTIPVIPPFDPTTIPGVTPVVPEVPEIEPITPGTFNIPIILGKSPKYDGSFDSPYESWDHVRSADSGNFFSGATSCFAGVFHNGFWWNIQRGFCTFDLSSYSGTIITAQIENNVDFNTVWSIQQGLQEDPVTIDDYNSWKPVATGGYSFGVNTVGETTDNIIPFSSNGVSYLNGLIGNVVKLCFRDYTYDFLNSAPGSINQFDGFTSFAKLVITI